MTTMDQWELLANSFVADPSYPYYINKVTNIFDLSKEDVNIDAHSTLDGRTVYSNHEKSAAENTAIELGVEACYGAFSAACSMKVSSNSSRRFHTSRLDNVVKATVKTLRPAAGFRLAPHKKLNPDVVAFIKEESSQAIAETIGHFFAVGACLGGQYQTTCIMEVSKKDDEKSLQAEFAAKGGFGICSGSAKGSVAISSRTTNEHAQMSTSWHCEGGDPTVWLSVTQTNFDEKQEEWAKTINDSNLFSFGYQLKPIWELVAKIDQDKGEDVKRFLMEQWAADGTLSLVWLDDSVTFSGNYILQNKRSGKNLNKRGNSNDNETLCQVYETDNTDSQWVISKNSDGYYLLKNVASNKYLNKQGHNNDNETLVQVYDTQNVDSQWEIIPANDGAGHYLLKNRASEKYLNKQGHQNANETLVQVYDTTNEDSQWKLKRC